MITIKNPLTKTSRTLGPVFSLRFKTPIIKNIAATEIEIFPTNSTKECKSFSRLVI